MQVTAQAPIDVQQVKEYDLFLDVDFESLKFSGRVGINIDSAADVKLDAVDLKVTSAKANNRNVSFKQHGNVVDIQTGRISGLLEVEYSGKVSESLTGFYKAPYGENYVLSTHFEAAHARRLLPCVDHPAYKADFKLTVRTRSDLSVISNMPLESEKKEGNKKIISFQKTPKMSTYLLYLGIGKFEEDTSRHNKTELYAASVVRPDGKIKTGLAFEAAQKSLEFYEKYFGIPYDLPKLHMIAVPEFAYGAMENWGAITFREILLHADKDTSTSTKKSIAEVIAHEIAHMWFGDLVTMKWWDDLWLNESFATFMAYKVVDWAFPQWKIWQDFVKNSTGGAMARDGLNSTHPIEAKVRSPEEIEELFDEISYGKGASILRMIEAYVGPDKFQKGVSKYLQQFRYSNATGRDLWNHLQQASGLDVSRVMDEWIKKVGYPVVKASLSQGKLLLEQERFMFSGVREMQTWPIPVTITVDGKTQQLLLDKERAEVKLTSPKSLKLNEDRTGFYRTDYRGRELQELVWSSKLSGLDRYGLANDAWAFLNSGRMSWKEYQKLLERFFGDEEYLPTFETSERLTTLFLIVPAKTVDLARRYHRYQLKILERKRDENSSLLKGIVALRLVMMDDSYAREVGAKFKDLANVEPDMKRAVIVGHARSSNDYDGLLDNYKKSTTDEDRLRYLEGLASFKQPDLVRKVQAFAMAGNVKRQDIGRGLLQFATSNPDAHAVTWEWFRDNIEKLDKMYEGTATLSAYMRQYISIIGVGRVGEIEKLFGEHKLAGADATLERLKIHDRLANEITKSLPQIA
ncbi:M1 family metallopeptidase [Candidatus Bathyarchaeota archaeon]|nr:MAG: M1 family metallopeptidase [Candidatus Bathyarchaeota archaeon]